MQLLAPLKATNITSSMFVQKFHSYYGYEYKID